MQDRFEAQFAYSGKIQIGADQEQCQQHQVLGDVLQHQTGSLERRYHRDQRRGENKAGDEPRNLDFKFALLPFGNRSVAVDQVSQKQRYRNDPEGAGELDGGADLQCGSPFCMVAPPTELVS